MSKGVQNGLGRKRCGFDLALSIGANNHPIREDYLDVVVGSENSTRFNVTEIQICKIQHASKIKLSIGALNISLPHSIKTNVNPFNVLQIEQQFSKINDLEGSQRRFCVLSWDNAEKSWDWTCGAYVPLKPVMTEKMLNHGN